MWESWSSPLHPGRTKSNDSDCWIVLSSNLPPENTSELCLMWTQGAQGVTKNKVNKKNNKHSSFKFISKKKNLQGFRASQNVAHFPNHPPSHPYPCGQSDLSASVKDEKAPLSPTRRTKRQVWRICGSANLGGIIPFGKWLETMVIGFVP